MQTRTDPTTLRHYGRPGMKWYQHIFGKNKEARKRETIEQKKKSVLKSRSPKQLYDHADLFTTQELKEAYDRLSLERNIANLSPKDVNKGKKFVENVTNGTRNAQNIFDNGIKIYNSMARVHNTFAKKEGSKPWAVINMNNDQKKDKD